MNNGTKIRTALRIAFSVYTAFCVWETAITRLSEQLHAPWLVALCAGIIVLSGLAVDALTTYYNNDYTEEGCIGTGVTRHLKKQREEGYIGDVFLDTIEEEHEEAGDEDE